MLDTLEYYSRDLERQIAAKKVEYERERQRADDINFMIGLKFIFFENILLDKAKPKTFASSNSWKHEVRRLHQYFC